MCVTKQMEDVYKAAKYTTMEILVTKNAKANWTMYARLTSAMLATENLVRVESI